MASEGTSFSLLYGLSVLFHLRLSNRIRYMSCVYIHSMRTPPTEGNLLDNFNRKNLFAQVHNSTNFVSQTSFPHASEMTLNSTESLEITVLRSKLRASYTPTPTTTLTAVTAMLCWLALNRAKQLSMASASRLRQCARVRHWPGGGLIGRCVTCS